LTHRNTTAATPRAISKMARISKSSVKSSRIPSLRAFAASAEQFRQARTVSTVGAMASDLEVNIVLDFCTSEEKTRGGMQDGFLRLLIRCLEFGSVLVVYLLVRASHS
jgi:hypothetical protein